MSTCTILPPSLSLHPCQFVILIVLFSISFFFKLIRLYLLSAFFFFNDTATTEIYTLSLHDALPILNDCPRTPAVLMVAVESRRMKNWYLVLIFIVTCTGSSLRPGTTRISLTLPNKIGRAHV